MIQTGASLFDGNRLSDLIDRYVNGKKSLRNREILREYYLKGYTYEEIAEHFELSPAQTGRIIRKYGETLLEML